MLTSAESIQQIEVAIRVLSCFSSVGDKPVPTIDADELRAFAESESENRMGLTTWRASSSVAPLASIRDQGPSRVRIFSVVTSVGNISETRHRSVGRASVEESQRAGSFLTGL